MKTYTDFDSIITATIEVNDKNIPHLYDWVLVINPFTILDNPSLSEIYSKIAFQYLTGFDGNIFHDIDSNNLDDGIYYVILAARFIEEDDICVECTLQSIIKLPQYKQEQYIKNNTPIV